MNHLDLAFDSSEAAGAKGQEESAQVFQLRCERLDVCLKHSSLTKLIVGAGLGEP